ncbi:MAG: DUF2605 domain-containing protein [Leptolyngbyaceae cyanobacterium]
MHFSEIDNSSEKPFMQTVLEPLLDDFDYWFSETQSLLESSKADCLAESDREDLLQELTETQQAVATARTLMLATDGNAGVDTAVVGQWHKLVNKCWQTSRYIRQQNQS